VAVSETGRGVTYARGFTAGAVAAGVKQAGTARLDVALIVSDRPAVAGAVFTTNQVIAAPCILTRRHVAGGPLRAIVVNSGNANACTGAQGDRDAAAMAGAAAERLGCGSEEIAVASTGVIGIPLPMDRVGPAIAAVQPSVGGWDDASRAIMTTDTRPKVAERVVDVGAHAVRIGGIAKGAGMIHPNMATLLVFITTDAAIDGPRLQRAVSAAADGSFNAISVDGDTSTNDTLLVLANGASGTTVSDAELPAFAAGLAEVCLELARAIVTDGEGVTKVFEVRVGGAATEADAVLAARTITTSNLVKTAVHGGDPNWGRILAAAGRSGARVDASRASVQIGGIVVFATGAPLPVDDAAIRAALGQAEIVIEVDLGLGDGAARAWGTDLSAEYVKINAEYTT
jgi:glutamate N-acetyltransferase/amino-acid N-acetyltransferase